MENEAMEIMENVADAIVEENNTVTMPVEGEATGANILTTLIRVGLITVTLGAAYACLKRNEIKEKVTKSRIKKLEKAGYVVLKANEIVDETCEDCVEEVAD